MTGLANLSLTFAHAHTYICMHMQYVQMRNVYGDMIILINYTYIRTYKRLYAVQIQMDEDEGNAKLLTNKRFTRENNNKKAKKIKENCRCLHES